MLGVGTVRDAVRSSGRCSLRQVTIQTITVRRKMVVLCARYSRGWASRTVYIQSNGYTGYPEVGSGGTATWCYWERLFARVHHFRRLVIGWEYHVENFFDTVRLGCMKSC